MPIKDPEVRKKWFKEYRARKRAEAKERKAREEGDTTVPISPSLSSSVSPSMSPSMSPSSPPVDTVPSGDDVEQEQEGQPRLHKLHRLLEELDMRKRKYKPRPNFGRYGWMGM